MLNLCTNVANLRRNFLLFFGLYHANHRKGRRILRLLVLRYAELIVFFCASGAGGVDSGELVVREGHPFRDDDAGEG